MPITKLSTYRVTCDGCGAHGGIWNERERPEDALPEGWVMNWFSQKTIVTGQLPAYSYLVLCRECQKGSSDDHEPATRSL